jgi:hypothetical protein
MVVRRLRAALSEGDSAFLVQVVAEADKEADNIVAEVRLLPWLL